jgi:hypothetical protein
MQKNSCLYHKDRTGTIEGPQEKMVTEKGVYLHFETAKERKKAILYKYALVNLNLKRKLVFCLLTFISVVRLPNLVDTLCCVFYSTYPVEFVAQYFWKI